MPHATRANQSFRFKRALLTTETDRARHAHHHHHSSRSFHNSERDDFEHPTAKHTHNPHPTPPHPSRPCTQEAHQQARKKQVESCPRPLLSFVSIEFFFLFHSRECLLHQQQPPTVRTLSLCRTMRVLAITVPTSATT